MRFLRSLYAMLAVAAVVAGLASAVTAQSLALPEPVGMQGDLAATIVLNGNAAFLHGDLTGAAADYREALRRKPDFAVATFNLGLVEAHQGRHAEALRDMNRGIALATEHGMGNAYVKRLRTLRDAFISQPVTG